MNNEEITTDWRGLYSQTWGDIITPEATRHPAKFSRALIRHIYEHAVAGGWIKPGGRIIDPFGGVGLGGFYAMKIGFNWTGVELEKHFHILGTGMDCPGFDRDFWKRYHKRGRAWLGLGICPSCGAALDNPPPFEPGFMGQPSTRPIPVRAAHRYRGNLETWSQRFGFFPGSANLINGDSRFIQSLVGSFDCAISSPPYIDSVNDGHSGIDFNKVDWKVAGIKTPGIKRIGPGTQGSQDHKMKYGESDGQLGAMAANGFDLAISSPPYANARIDGNGDEGASGARMENGEYLRGPDGWKVRKAMGQRYGESDGQLGAMAANDTTGDFWIASRAIVDQVFAILKPGGHAIWVVKDFVKDKARVEFCDQWLQLCQAAGFVLACQHRAWMVQDKGNARALFDFEDGSGNTIRAGEVVRIEDGQVKPREKNKKSFFRRLAEKNGSPPIDWEMVICMQKPTGEPVTIGE